MDEGLPTALHELLSDPDIAWVEQQLMAHVSGLERQGLPPRTIARAMARVLFAFCKDRYDQSIGSRLWIKKFLQQTGRDFIQEEEFTSDCEKLFDLQDKFLKDSEPHGTA
jgi:hypothetical protein